MSLAVDTLAILTRCAAEALSSEQETLDALRTNDVVVLSDKGNLTISAQIIE